MTEQPNDRSKVMKDGTIAYLTQSGSYYFLAGPDRYWHLDGSRIEWQEAECDICHDIIASRRCGQYVSCRCGMSGVDTDRWMPERQRFIGHAIPITSSAKRNRKT